MDETFEGNNDAIAKGAWYAIRDKLSATERENIEEVARQHMIELGYGPDEITDENDVARIENLMRVIVATANR